MSNPNYGFRFINDGETVTKKQRAETNSKLFQAGKMKGNKKRHK